jgi:hypothetical protein
MFLATVRHCKCVAPLAEEMAADIVNCNDLMIIVYLTYSVSLNAYVSTKFANIGARCHRTGVAWVDYTKTGYVSLLNLY